MDIPEIPDWIQILIDDAAEKGRQEGWDDGYRHAMQRARAILDQALERF